MLQGNASGYAALAQRQQHGQTTVAAKIIQPEFGLRGKALLVRRPLSYAQTSGNMNNTNTKPTHVGMH